jgi:L-aspartate oxidase
MGAMATKKTDVLVIGSGLAGLALALKLAKQGKVTLLTKENAPDTNTAWAQGGIAAVMSSQDSFEDHIQDTLTAGAGLCKDSVVRRVIEQAPERIKDLVNWGVHFDLRKEDSSDHLEVDLTREGGHSFRRILHFEDSTGAEIHRTLMARVAEEPNIEILEQHFAIDLLMNKQIDPDDMGPPACKGVYALNKKTGEVDAWIARATVLATGGAGKVYLYTSNWGGATGDGIAMAYRAGARIANLEFMQFHPTCLYHREARNFLISEAMRGEGGELVNGQGQAFMSKYHELGSLAPRDIVARSIDAEMKLSGAPCVYLDMTHLKEEFLRVRFPGIFAKCLEFGIDMSRQPIPVVPAAHYLCGGVMTDAAGRTDLLGLWALGETACTGLHGANRLASNSLLEATSMAHDASVDIQSHWEELAMPSREPRPWISPVQSDADEMIVIHHMWDEIRRLMWNYVGIVRSNKRLERAQSRLKNILSEVSEYYSNFQVHSDILELRNIATVADLTVECALRRKESRGIHYNLDYPFTTPDHDRAGLPQEEAQDTILIRGLK